MAAAVSEPGQLLSELLNLNSTVQAKVAEEQSFRKLNAGFNLQNETTQMLVDVCEKLAAAKEARERALFEEHTSELPFLCKRLGTALDTGLSERVHRERYAGLHPGEHNRRERMWGNLFAVCCFQEFPPRQSWWTDAHKRLLPTFQVLRGGRLVATAPGDLVPGDIYFLTAGQRVAVDGRILVHVPETAVDMSLLTSDQSDVRLCSTEPTAEATTASRNMVFKDSFVTTGAIFCLALRPGGESLIPLRARDADDTEFTVDMTLPPGLSLSQSRSTFKALCVQARLVCRSFQALVKLGRVNTLVVLLSKDLLGTAAALCAAAQRLGRALILVDCGCKRAALEALARDSGLDLQDFSSGRSSRSIPSSPTGRSGPSSPRGLLSEGELQKLQALVRSLGTPGARAGGRLISGLSQRGLTSLCTQLAGIGRAPLYAMGTFEYPETFKALVLMRKGPQLRPSFSGASPFKEEGMADGQPVPPPPQRLTTQVSEMSMPVAPENSHMSAVYSTESVGTASAAMVSEDPSSGLWLQNGRYVNLLVSLNSIGVVSEHADGVLMKSDLGCLGTALEIAAKATAETDPA